MAHWQHLSIQADANHDLLLYHAERERVDPWTPPAACRGELPLWFNDLADHPLDLVAFLTRMSSEGWGNCLSNVVTGSAGPPSERALGHHMRFRRRCSCDRSGR